MKTKLIRSKGFWRLVVADAVINEKYGATNKDPIILGIISHYFDSGHWAVQDYRLKQYLHPTRYLEESLQSFLPKSVEARDHILSTVDTPRIDERGVIHWTLFDSFEFEGDKPPYAYGNAARFSFALASKKLAEQRAFWDSFNKDDLTLDEIRVENKFRQPRDLDFYVQFSKKEEE